MADFRLVLGLLGLEAKLDARVAIEGSLAIRNVAADRVWITQVPVLFVVLGDVVGTVMATGCLLFEGEIISLHSLLQLSIVLLCVQVGATRLLPSLIVVCRVRFCIGLRLV